MTALSYLLCTLFYGYKKHSLASYGGDIYNKIPGNRDFVVYIHKIITISPCAAGSWLNRTPNIASRNTKFCIISSLGIEGKVFSAP